jgi:hypothetical protein
LIVELSYVLEDVGISAALATVGVVALVLSGIARAART